MEIIVNEWLLDYLHPDAQESNKTAAMRFVNALVKKCDKMVIRGNSPFVSKFYSFMGRFGWDASFKERFSKLYRLLFRNSDKTIIVDDADMEALPSSISAIIPPDDVYLIELWYSAQGRIVLTTDTKLKEKLKNVPNLKICLLDEFLQQYLT
jgi:hypothetical protein